MEIHKRAVQPDSIFDPKVQVILRRERSLDPPDAFEVVGMY